MRPRDPSYLTDILEAAKQIQSFVHGIDKEQFDGGALIQSAVVRQVEIIGEAAKPFQMNSGRSIPRFHGERSRGCATS